MPEQCRVLVTGAGGFIGHHLVTFLKKKGYWVRGVDIKRPEFAPSDADEFALLDLRVWDNCVRATRGVDQVFALAADMGGMGFISSHHAEILLQQLPDQLPHAGSGAGPMVSAATSILRRPAFIPSTSRLDANVAPLKEEDAYPAQPQDAYGWEKLIDRAAVPALSARVRHRNAHRSASTTCSARWVPGTAGREKAPAALCRKIAIGRNSPAIRTIEIWGDGEQTRSFCYIDDCVEGLYRLMRSDFRRAA